jgi:hypothetical protein
LVEYLKMISLKALSLVSSDNNFFWFFTICIYWKWMTTGGGGNFDPRALIWTILLEVHFTMVHAKYLTSGISQLLEEIF